MWIIFGMHKYTNKNKQTSNGSAKGIGLYKIDFLAFAIIIIKDLYLA
jgi:hypothetical protein